MSAAVRHKQQGMGHSASRVIGSSTNLDVKLGLKHAVGMGAPGGSNCCFSAQLSLWCFHTLKLFALSNGTKPTWMLLDWS